MQISDFRVEVVRGPRGEVNPHGNVDLSGKPTNWPCVGYEVELWRGDVLVWSGPYYLGVGHVKPRSVTWYEARTIARPDRADAVESLAATWSGGRMRRGFRDAHLWAALAAWFARRQKVKPSVEDVLSVIVLEGAAFFDAQSFEEWCDDFGVSADIRKSERTRRKAKRTYLTCVEIGRRVVAALGTAAVEELREITADTCHLEIET